MIFSYFYLESWGKTFYMHTHLRLILYLRFDIYNRKNNATWLGLGLADGVYVMTVHSSYLAVLGTFREKHCGNLELLYFILLPKNPLLNRDNH